MKLKSICLFVVLAPLLFCGCAPSNPLTEMEWLLGDWQRENESPDKVTMESWQKITETEMAGMGVTTRDGDTVFVEKLRIFQRDEDLFYSADVAHNESAVLFQLTSSQGDSLVFENAAHDFPKMITYRKSGPGSMTATISGDGNSVQFRFKRMSGD